MYDYEREENQPAQYGADSDFCEHGTYVGGCGIDWMCGDCELGISAAEARQIETQRRTRIIREKSEEQQLMISRLLSHGHIQGRILLDILEVDNKYVRNPLNRYGRH